MMGRVSFIRELRFFLKEPHTFWVVIVAMGLSIFSVWSGLTEIERQNSTIERLVVADSTDRKAVQTKETDYGSAAYYSFHLTYDPPTKLSFAAHGERNVFPWKHRIRMLAVEGQIYESDVANAELAQSGHFDFAFVLAVLSPLFLIILLHDQRASEKTAGRYDLLVVTGGHGGHLWQSRTMVRVCLLGTAVFLPFLVGAVVAGVQAEQTLWVLLIVVAQFTFWTLLCLWVSSFNASGPAIASYLLAIWILTTFVVPAVSDTIVESAIDAPDGGELILTQREAVNDAWDLPKQATMEPFVEQHPEWADYAEIESTFEWKWYYAFQQVGDQTVADMSSKRRSAILQRDKLAGWFSLLSPASLTQRALSSLAGTNVKAALRYQQSVRDFHASLREFYYPLMFQGAPYDIAVFADMQQFRPR